LCWAAAASLPMLNDCHVDKDLVESAAIDAVFLVYRSSSQFTLRCVHLAVGVQPGHQGSSLHMLPQLS